MALTENQKRFADYYLETGNQTEAYMRAYPTTKKRETAKAAASRLMTNVNVSEYIEERRRQMDEKRIATVDEVLLFFSQVMRGEVKDQFGLDSQLSDRINAGKELMKRFKDIGETGEQESTDDGFLDALKGTAAEDWDEE